MISSKPFFQSAMSISRPPLQLFSFFFWWSFAKFVWKPKSKSKSSVTMFSFFFLWKESPNFGKKKIVEFFHHIWIVILVLVAFFTSFLLTIWRGSKNLLQFLAESQAWDASQWWTSEDWSKYNCSSAQLFFWQLYDIAKVMIIHRKNYPNSKFRNKIF